MPDNATLVPEEKRFPVVFRMTRRRAAPAAAPPASEPAPGDVFTRVARKSQWHVTSAGSRWVIDAGEGRRVLVERTKEGTGPLRLARIIDGPGSAAPRATELLRQNATLAHCGYASDQDGRTALVATLMEDSADEEEIEAALRSLVGGGERVTTRPLATFDSSAYKQAPPAGESWPAHVLGQAFTATGTAWQMTGAHAVVVLRLPGGRKQTVHVLFDRADPKGEQLVQMISVCGPATNADLWMRSLVANASQAFATLALATLGGEEKLVVLRTQLARTADREEILVGITTVGQIADRLEVELTGGRDAQ